MRNVIIFSDRPSSDIQYALRDNDDYDVRVKSINELKEAEFLNLPKNIWSFVSSYFSTPVLRVWSWVDFALNSIYESAIYPL